MHELLLAINDYEINIYNQINRKMRYQLKTNEEIKVATKLWCLEREKAIKLYGHISLWDTSKITNMSYLFSCFHICIVFHIRHKNRHISN